MSLHAAMPCKNFPVILKILLKELRNIQLVWALGKACAAADTLLDLLHLCLPVPGKPAGAGRTAKHKRHTVTVVYLDAHGTRHAIAAASAEITHQLFSL